MAHLQGLKKCLLIAFLLLGAIVSNAQVKNKPLAKGIIGVESHLMTPVQFADSAYQFFTLQERMKIYGVPSISIAVIDNGKVAWSKAYGLADVASGRKATTGTLYQAASMSKSVNAVAAMRLVKAGKLDLDKDFRGYLKTWIMPENEFSKGKIITLRQLLSHTAGMSVGGFNGYGAGDTLPSLNQILNGVKPANSESVKPLALAGQKFSYSGGGTVISRKIMEDQTGMTYQNILDTEVLKPLSMQSSTYELHPENSWKDWATAYTGEKQEVAGKYKVYPELAPDALWTTPSDMAKFVLAVQASLNNQKPEFLSKSEVLQLLTPVLDSAQNAPGFFILKKGNSTYFQHAGSNVGFKSNFYGSFEGGRGVVVMMNCDEYDIIPEIINSVAYTYNWKDFYKPELRKLSAVPLSLLKQYQGNYKMEKPAVMNFQIRTAGNNLELSSDGKTFERMYFTNQAAFFLLSSKQLTFRFEKMVTGKFELIIKQGSDEFKAPLIQL